MPHILNRANYLTCAHIPAVIQQQKASWCDQPVVYRDHSNFTLDKVLKSNLFKEPVLDEMLQNEDEIPLRSDTVHPASNGTALKSCR